MKHVLLFLALLLLIGSEGVTVGAIGTYSNSPDSFLELLEGAGLPHPSGAVAIGKLSLTPQGFFSSVSSLQPGLDVQVTFDTIGLPQNEPSIAVSPKDPSKLVAGANDYRLALVADAWAGVYLSTDGGAHWVNNLVPGYPGGPSHTLTGFDVAADPGVAFDNSGSVYYSGIAFNRPIRDGSVFVAKSTDGLFLPASTKVVIIAKGSGTRIFNDKPYLAVDNSGSTFDGRVYVSWTRFASNRADIMLSSSKDGGTTWSAPVVLNDSPGNQGSVPAVGPRGEVYVAWRDFTNNHVKIAKSTDGGSSFTAPITVSNLIPIPNPLPNSRFRTNSNPALAVDEVNGVAYVAWADYRSRNADILLSRSIDGGTTWSSPSRVNDDTTSNDQFFPWMSSSGQGLGVIFYDRREDPFNHDIHTFFARSTNGGVSFEANLKVTDFPINPDLGFDGQFIGDYIGLASTLSKFHPAWTDTRNAIDGPSFDQDIFTDTLASPITIHDIAVLVVSINKLITYNQIDARPLSISVKVGNEGTVGETFNVEVSISPVGFPGTPILIGSQTLSLAGGGTMLLKFEWGTKLVSKGSYLISATASTVMGESDILDNKLDGGTVQVRFPGDTNGDGKVDIIDIATVAIAFGTKAGDPGFKPESDLDNDGDVDIVDIAIVAKFFGIKDP